MALWVRKAGQVECGAAGFWCCSIRNALDSLVTQRLIRQFGPIKGSVCWSFLVGARPSKTKRWPGDGAKSSPCCGPCCGPCCWTCCRTCCRTCWPTRQAKGRPHHIFHTAWAVCWILLVVDSANTLMWLSNYASCLCRKAEKVGPAKLVAQAALRHVVTCSWWCKQYSSPLGALHT